MKLFSNNRQKLILNRVKKPQTLPKVSIEVVNGCKMGSLHNPFSNKDINILKMRNSSIFKKQLENRNNRQQKSNNHIVRCRSISQIDNNKRQNLKTIPHLRKINFQAAEEKPSARSAFKQILNSHCANVVLSLKKRGILAMKSNFYNISIDSFNQLLEELSEKIIQQAIKSDQKRLTEIQSYKDIDSSELLQKNQQKLKVYNQFSLNQQIKKLKNLSYQSQNINFHLQCEQSTNQKKTFWKILENYEIEKPTQQNFNFLLQKNKYLKQQIIDRETQLNQILQIIDQNNKNFAQKQKYISNMEEKIKQHENTLSQVQKNVKEIQSFINKQPNRILQQEAEGFKQSEQQLFDMAFMFQQSAPSSIAFFVQQSIFIPFQSFKLTLKSFPHEKSVQDSYLIPSKDVQAFKSSINNAYESTIEKLRTIIEKKAGKIKIFVGIMRRLASYTIGKRQYLTQINKKMAVFSINIEKRLKLMEECCRSHNESEQKIKNITEIKQLIDKMKSIYYQAEVFY